jgi:flagellar biosynthetic protein FlhB
MAEESGAEKTEDPTSKKLQNAREKGQVARSAELPAAAVTIGAVLVMFMMGSYWMKQVAEIFAAGFKFDRKTLDNPDLMVTTFADQLGNSFLLIVPVLMVTAVMAILSSGATGGYLFSLKSIAPDFGKLSLLSGFSRMFGARAAVELLKAILKFTLVSVVLWALVSRQVDAMMKLGQMAIEPALAAAGWMIGESALWLSLSLLIIALIDAPYQKYAFIKQMRMTKQEVKDEMKDMEGSPEVKQQIRRRQREMANNKMLQKVKDADVVITNPEHFAVALSYDPTGDGAPILLAKGSDHMAARIREEARIHNVEMFAAPPLARALYFSTEVNYPVPESLYLAVAQVIAYVFSLADVRPGIEPMAKPNPKVPASMQFDANGKIVPN